VYFKCDLYILDFNNQNLINPIGFHDEKISKKKVLKKKKKKISIRSCGCAK
jgi:hypothetical protein